MDLLTEYKTGRAQKIYTRKTMGHYTNFVDYVTVDMYTMGGVNDKATMKDRIAVRQYFLTHSHALMFCGLAGSCRHQLKNLIHYTVSFKMPSCLPFFQYVSSVKLQSMKMLYFIH